jgi:hypothetical protein
MTTSNLPVYYSKDKLSNRFSDYSNVYLLPSICAFGVLTNSASILVTFRMRNKDHMTKYILINSSIDFLFLLTQFFLFIIRCGILCPFGYTYAAKFYENYIYLFSGYLLILFQNFFNFFMTIERLALLSKTNKYRQMLAKLNTKWLYVSLFIMAVLLNSPIYFFLTEITPLGIFTWNTSQGINTTEILFFLNQKNRDLFLSQALRTTLVVIENPFFMILTGLVNILVAVKFKKFIQKKQKILKIETKGKIDTQLFFKLQSIFQIL